MSEATLDDRGRMTLPKDLRERYGDRYRIVEVHDGIKLIPVAEDPLDALRDEFAGVEKTADELREEAREAAFDEAGR
ncbi:bifunctional DNA-binding transcriptional regulator/antitoxin component of YhaV-PrlF toxin-antitoxin module [Halorubrum trapanicum]|uniref:Bifunctional DNA-binding transcriptional regulator/antitoxin component of YhaV-PrlF toxin-antitoxin module n=1 Tax=Halorubrum trapanicum TaxID=29284 RepID=A0A8J7RBS6_9EURY|nr:AbrB/MazE/SpoVT family DNA-binding domain-containing protein [Halorubrum trapanicum]MBP1901046.1 bifunctional DNA-binding transcriptional regulator/antitoxin component of YhaV-PrlF toxin-antitoxin module [Halorubrum trapanicum]